MFMHTKYHIIMHRRGKLFVLNSPINHVCELMRLRLLLWRVFDSTLLLIFFFLCGTIVVVHNYYSCVILK